MSELRPGWRRVRFGEIAEHITDRVDDPSESGVERYVGLEHLDTDSLTIRRWGSPDQVESTKLRFRPGDIIFGKRRAYQRKLGLANFEGICSAHAMVLRAREDTIVPELLPYLMQSDFFMERAIAISVGSLSPTINWKTLAAEEFALPPREVQRDLANEMLAIGGVIEAHLDSIQAIRSVKQSLLQNFVLRHDRWGSVRLSDVSRIVRGSSPRPAGDPRFFNGADVPWITVGELTKCESMTLDTTETKLTQEGARRSRVIPAGTVVLSNSGFSLGVPKILGLEGCANDGVAAFLELSDSMDHEFLYYCLLGLTDHFRQRVAAGGDQPNLNTARIGRVEVPCPPIHLQREAVEMMKAVDAVLGASRQRLQTCRSMLIQRQDSVWRGGNGIH